MTWKLVEFFFLSSLIFFCIICEMMIFFLVSQNYYFFLLKCFLFGFTHEKKIKLTFFPPEKKKKKRIGKNVLCLTWFQKLSKKVSWNSFPLWNFVLCSFFFSVSFFSKEIFSWNSEFLMNFLSSMKLNEHFSGFFFQSEKYGIIIICA